MSKYNIIELFSGIGSQFKALKNIGVKTNVINICEWDINAFVAYDAIFYGSKNLSKVERMTKDEILDKLQQFNLSNNSKTLMQHKILKSYSYEALKRVYTAIIRCKNVVDVNQLKGEQITEPVDLLTYSFPCQDLSNVGAFHGYKKGIDKNSGSRSSLLWQVGRILEEIKFEGKKPPRFLILENVPALLSKRHIDNFNIWKSDLESLGYYNKVYKLNSSSYGTPQNRPRLFMISILLPSNEEESKKIIEELDSFFSSHDLANNEYIKKLNIKPTPLSSLLRTNYKIEKYWNEACLSQQNDTISRRKIWQHNPKLIDENGNMNYEIARTITTKQDRNPNSGNIYFDYENNIKSKFRYLTPRECFLLMGFEDHDFDRILENNPRLNNNFNLFTRDKLYRMAGNSIPVKMLEQVFKQIIEIDNTIIKKIDIKIIIRKSYNFELF